MTLPSNGRLAVGGLLALAWLGAAAGVSSQDNQMAGVTLTPTRAAGRVYMPPPPGR